MEVYSHSEAETKRIGQKIGKILRPGDMVLLSGDLGAGKTVLSRGIVAALGGDEAEVHSPSYTYVNCYSADIPIYHLDVYLLEHYDDFLELGIEDFWNTPGIMLIEWGDKFRTEYYHSYWLVTMKYTEQEQVRFISINVPEAELERRRELIAVL